jgi:hypothetical protein
VVLELGYALSIKSEDQVFITFRMRKSKGTAPKWILSDIGHLQRHEYVNVPALEGFVRQQLDLIPFSKGYAEFGKQCEATNAADKYRTYGKKVLQALRDEGSKSKRQVQGIMAGSACRLTKMLSLLRKNKLIYRPRGRYGKFAIPDLRDDGAG